MNNLKKLAGQIHGLDEVGGCELMEVEAQWLQQATDEMRQAADLIEQQRRELEELELQVRAIALLQDEVTAQNESLGEALHQTLIHWAAMGVKDEDGLAYAECEKRLEQSPQTSLAEVRARAVESFIDNELRSSCLANGWGTDSSAYEVHLMLNDYVNKIRNGETKRKGGFITAGEKKRIGEYL